MDVEYIFTRRNGQRLSIVGKVKVRFGCTCDGSRHMHADDVTVDSIIDMETDMPAMLDPHEVMEVEQDMTDIAYEDAG